MTKDILSLFCAVTDPNYKPPNWVSGISLAVKFSITTLVLLLTLTVSSIIVSVVLIKRFFDKLGQEVDYL